VIYLVILVTVAAVGILRLWLYQRRELARMNSIDGFRKGLRAISPEAELPATPAQASVPQARPSWDEDRRDAAKRRIEARRRARAAS
jgi:hypothetical protein